MLKKTITYTDYDGVERTEDFYFNLTKAEVLEMEVSVSGGLSGLLTRIVQIKDTKEIMRVFKEIILKSYGVKEPGGQRFIKSDELSVAFMQTEAYSDYLMLLATNDAEATAFVNGIMPKVPNPPPSSK